MNRVLKMNRFFKSCLLASAGLVILAVTLSFTASGRAVAQRVEEGCIRICDTASNPLHVIVRGITRVTGEVKINNENAIATTVTGPVQVATSRGESLSVRPRLKIDDIFQEQISLTLKPGEHLATQNFVVPAGKFLEIKHASGTITIKGPGIAPPGPFEPLVLPSFNVSVRVIQPNNGAFNFPLARDFQGFSYSDNVALANYQVGGNQIGIFGDSGGTVQVLLDRFPFGNDLQPEIKLEMAITGEYHDF